MISNEYLIIIIIRPFTQHILQILLKQLIWFNGNNSLNFKILLFQVNMQLQIGSTSAISNYIYYLAIRLDLDGLQCMWRHSTVASNDK